METNFLKTFCFFLASCMTCAGKLRDASPIHNLHRRSILQFNSMISCASTTGHSGLDYLGYGCHCGLGGSGTPVDDVDRCCENHDMCWGALYAEGTCDRTVIFQFASFEHSQTNCNQAEAQITCNAQLNDQCKQALCECDRVAALCFAQATYNEEYRSYDKAKKCRDPSASPDPTTMTTTPSPDPTTMTTTPSPVPSTTNKAQKSPSPLFQVIFMTCALSVYIMHIKR